MFTLFDSNKIKILKSKIIKENKLDISGKILAKNENKIIFELNWGFKSSYENNIRIFGENGTINVNFIFSKKIFNRELYIRYTQPPWRGSRNPLLHIPKVGREAAYSALWY